MSRIRSIRSAGHSQRVRWLLVTAAVVAAINVAAPGTVDAAPGAGLTPITPSRLLDTRPGQPTIDGQFAGTGAFSPGASR